MKIDLCAIAKNEGLYLEEWINFHLRIGFDSITVYDNESTDGGTVPLHGRGRVHVRSWPTPTGASPQITAYNDFLIRAMGQSDWVMFLDIDEFLNLKAQDNVHDFIKSFNTVDGIAINWRMFGSSGEITRSPLGVLKRFKSASLRSFPPNAHIKTIFRPSAVSKVSVHSPVFLEGAKLVDTRGFALPATEANVLQHDINFDVAQINHYFVKSGEEFEIKRARGRADFATDDDNRFRRSEEFSAYDRNDELDDTIARFDFRGKNSADTTSSDLSGLVQGDKAHMKPTMSKIYKANPYADFDLTAYPIDMQGWGFEDSVFGLAIAALQPSTIIEVGSWKGMSAMKMARIVKALAIDCELVCIDTWLGSPEHIMADHAAWYDSLQFKNGYPQLFYTFMANVVSSDLQDVITPLPATSENAAYILKHWETTADIIYIDAAHEFEPAKADFERFWPLLSDRGVMICDDYIDGWPGVKKAVDAFVEENGLEKSFVGKPGKAMIAKEFNPVIQAIALCSK